MKMYNLIKEKGLLENENLICKEVAIPETIHEVESCPDYDSDLSENSVTTSNESEMTDLAGLFAESETEVNEIVWVKGSLFTIVLRILFLVGQEFIKSKYFLQTIWLILFTLSLILNPSTNVPVATMLIPAIMCLYLPWVGQYCRQLIWRFWLKKTKKKFILLQRHSLKIMSGYVQQDKIVLTLDE